MTDDEVRALERAAAAGDLDAERRLVSVRERQGRPRFTITRHPGDRSRQIEHGPPVWRGRSNRTTVELEFDGNGGDESTPADLLDVLRAVNDGGNSPNVVLVHDHEKGKSYVLAQLGRYMPPPKPEPPKAPASPVLHPEWEEDTREMDAFLRRGGGSVLDP